MYNLIGLSKTPKSTYIRTVMRCGAIVTNFSYSGTECCLRNFKLFIKLRFIWLNYRGQTCLLHCIDAICRLRWSFMFLHAGSTDWQKLHTTFSRFASPRKVSAEFLVCLLPVL